MSSNPGLQHPSQGTRPSRWFLSSLAALMVLLAISIAVAFLVTLRQSAQLRTGLIAGSSMEPTLQGPKQQTTCPQCQRENIWTLDSWIPSRELKCQFCDAFLDTNNTKTIPGKSIDYVPILLVNKKGLLPQGAPRSILPVQRWELAVIRTPDDQLGQVKRVVGLPNEQVSIQSGRIYINGNPVLPSPTAFLRQAIVVAKWPPPPHLNQNKNTENNTENNNPPTQGDAFLKTIKYPLLNDLKTNAHDSHQLLPALDAGIALKLRTNEPSWNLHLTMLIDDQEIPIEISTYERTTSIHAGSRSVAVLPTNWNLEWLNFLVLGDTFVILDGKQELGRMPLETFVESHRRNSTPLNASRVRWTDLPTIDPNNLLQQIILYRGRIYRGANDSDSQSFPASDGWIVLGDNVSISEDSRSFPTDQSRILKQHLQGVVIEPESLMHNLLQQ